MTGAEFRQAQAQTLEGRTECWYCGFLFDKKTEMTTALISIKVGKVVTAEYTTTAIINRTDIMSSIDNIDDMPERPNLYSEQPRLICLGCRNAYAEDMAHHHFDEFGNWLDFRSPTDLYLD